MSNISQAITRKFNLFYDCLPFELQHKILIWSSVSQIVEKRKLLGNSVSKQFFIYIYKKTHGCYTVPKWVTHDIFIKNNIRLYWSCMLNSGVDHIQMMASPILSMKWMKQKTLIHMCLTNELEIKKNWSKQRLISHLLKI